MESNLINLFSQLGLGQVESSSRQETPESGLVGDGAKTGSGTDTFTGGTSPWDPQPAGLSQRPQYGRRDATQGVGFGEEEEDYKNSPLYQKAMEELKDEIMQELRDTSEEFQSMSQEEVDKLSDKLEALLKGDESIDPDDLDNMTDGGLSDATKNMLDRATGGGQDFTPPDLSAYIIELQKIAWEKIKNKTLVNRLAADLAGIKDSARLASTQA